MTPAPTPHLSRNAESALARGEVRDPESYDLGLPPCDHADTIQAACPACDGAGFHLTGHASPTCVEQRDCADCEGTGRTSERRCVGCGCEVAP